MKENDLKYIEKVLMSCKTMDQLMVGYKWALNLSSSSYGSPSSLGRVIRYKNLFDNMCDYIEKRKKVYGDAIGFR